MSLYLIARIGGERVAILAEAVESVVEVGVGNPVPRAPAHVAGLAALRSRVLTLIDTLASLELGRSQVDAETQAVVVVVEGHLYGLLVEHVEDVVDIPGALRPMRARLAPGWQRVAAGVIEHEGQWLVVVSAAEIVAGPPARAA